MDAIPFKTLAEAKDVYAQISEQLPGLQAKAAELESLTALNADLQTQLAAIGTEHTDLKAKFEALNVENLAAISAKNDEIIALKSEKATFETQVQDLKKVAKSVKATARELVAASAAPAPASVDNSEVELEGKDLIKAMSAEHDPNKLYALYEQFKKQSSPQ